ncbi:succinylglutamate desuccinylase/aspartoacylase family protein [Microbulbifer salipaludis]|uniref:Succinylglutamate desuccinylase/aspartoacylase family protein n=1 Tax=Microbulbifer salipaludis TaxID=187980 RepID=A0ABS3EAL2_9GAMM|nr:succinylglutamate desuccinylase/aspartoacylase family protein [Microbulbifer salipaludis]MBN8432335.1 succinylglutamate desuccinylase/aspartoacylase family protein [Microbulbifer salipaludis]
MRHRSLSFSLLFVLSGSVAAAAATSVMDESSEAVVIQYPTEPSGVTEQSQESATPQESTQREAGEQPEKPMPKAKSIELDKPVTERDLVAPPESDATEPSAASPVPRSQPKPQPKPQPEAPQTEKPAGHPLQLLGAEVPAGTSTRLAWSPSQHFEGVYSATPVLVVNGAETGPTLCLTAAIHGDELNGIETVRRVMYNLNPQTLKGAVIGVPIVNMQGFHRSSRYLTDRRDLNRHFPGDKNGSSASRIARSFFDEVVVHCNAIVDLHTGSFYRTNLPQLRGDLKNPKVVKLTKGFGSTVVLHSDGAKGTLRRAAVEAGIPTVTLEAGAPMVLDERSVSHSVKGIRTLLNQLGMVSKFRLWGDPEPVYYNSTWQRATTGGIIFSKVELGSTVSKGDLLGTVTNPITNVRKEIRSLYNGRILGMAMNQVVQPGFAAYHIGIQAPEEQISAPEEVTAEAEPAPTEDNTNAGGTQPQETTEEEAVETPQAIDAPPAEERDEASEED